MSARAQTRRLGTGIIVGLALVVFGPPLAGMAFLALQVLHDTSYDLSRIGLSDLPQAALALAITGSAYGYLYGLIPAGAAALGVAWLAIAGKRLSLAAVLGCTLLGGGLGAVIGSPIVGATQALGIVVLMLALVSLAWWACRRTGLLAGETLP